MDDRKWEGPSDVYGKIPDIINGSYDEMVLRRHPNDPNDGDDGYHNRQTRRVNALSLTYFHEILIIGHKIFNDINNETGYETDVAFIYQEVTMP